jgi:hypothetical protein
VPLRSSTQVNAYATDANIETPIAAATILRSKVFRRILFSPRMDSLSLSASYCLDPHFGYSRNIAELFRPGLGNIVGVGDK